MDKNISLDLAFRALADGTRRQIIERLYVEAESSAGALVSCFDSAQPTISKHLSVLEKAGLVNRKVEGRRHLFSLNKDRLADVELWFERHRRIWENSLDNLEAILNKKKSGLSK